MKLFNTLTRKSEEFKPAAPDGVVRFYTCGPTVYNYLHVGNYRTYVFEDALKRTLKFLGFKVRHVMNVTDVGHLTSQADEGEDKVAAQAAKEGKTAWDIAKFYERTFIEDIAKLNIDFQPEEAVKKRPDSPGDILCRATEHIKEQIELIKRLEAKGLTYKTSDGVYFDTSKFKGYGRLAGGAHIEGIQEGARVAANREKRRPTDFALWKFAPKGSRQMEWDSPWGWGFPGWHIECSAMAMKYLGESFDIHCGGVDHIPIHHTNEIAQAEGATGKPFVRFWLHGEFLVVNKAKMAKSAGGFIRLQDLQEKGFDPLDYRYFCYTAHYRKQLEFSWEALEAAKNGRRRLRERVLDLEHAAGGEVDSGPGCAEFQARIADDLDMPGALAALWDLLSRQGRPAAILGAIRQAEEVLALGLFASLKEEPLPANAQDLFDRYVEARKKKDFAASDKLRKELADSGIKVEDTAAGSRWRRL